MADMPNREAWHPAFCAAANFELREDRDALELISEYNLSKEPLRTDLLIIKKEQGRVIKKDIQKCKKSRCRGIYRRSAELSCSGRTK